MSAYMGPLNLAVFLTAWWLGSESEYSKGENSKRYRQKLQGIYSLASEVPETHIYWSSKSLKPA